jgi:hypothetical protein
MTLAATKKVLLSLLISGRKHSRSINPVIYPAIRRNTMGSTRVGSWIPMQRHRRFAKSGTGYDRFKPVEFDGFLKTRQGLTVLSGFFKEPDGETICPLKKCRKSFFD